MIKEKKILNRIQNIKSNTRDIEEIKQQFETPISVTKQRPANREGQDGDRKVVKEGNNNYLYIKVDARWMKTELEEVI